MFRVYRYYASADATGESRDPVTAGDEGFFVGESNGIASLERTDRSGETGEADDTVEDDVGGHLGELGGCGGAGNLFGFETFEGARLVGLEGDVSGPELPGLFCECFSVSSGGKTDYFEAIGVGSNDVERLEAYAARGAEDGETTFQEDRRIVEGLIA
jgi:hypothetical protein